MNDPRSNAEALGLVAGFTLWSLAFVVLYAVHGYACGVGVEPGDPLVRAVLIGLFGAFVALHAWLAWWLWKRWQGSAKGAVHYVRLASLVLAIAAGGATVWTGVPILTLTICA